MKNFVRLQKLSFLVLAGSLFFTSCEQDQLVQPASQKDLSNSDLPGAPKPPKGTFFYGLSDSNELSAFTSGNPVQEHGTWAITGLDEGERVLGIDFRPATGQLYGVTNMSRLCTINTSTGMATLISATPFTPAINGTEVGFDFNPTVDRIRLVTNTTQNLRLHPTTGAVVVIDGNLKPGEPSVGAVAYTNSFAGATTTTLYDIDAATDKLYRQMPPNDGVLMEVGSLGLQITGEGGFDISSDNSVALAVLFGRGADDEDQSEESNGNKTRFYYIDLNTGAAKNAGKTDRNIVGLAIPTIQ